jgi:hypothetical protein
MRSHSMLPPSYRNVTQRSVDSSHKAWLKIEQNYTDNPASKGHLRVRSARIPHLATPAKQKERDFLSISVTEVCSARSVTI